MHVELEVVGADLDRTLEGGECVLRKVERRAAVGDQSTAGAPAAAGRSVDELVCSAHPFRAERARQSDNPRPRRLRSGDADVGVLEDEHRAGLDLQETRGGEVALRVGLAVRDVVLRDDQGDRVSDPGGSDDGIDLAACRGGDDRHGGARRREANRGAHLVVEVEPSAARRL